MKIRIPELNVSLVNCSICGKKSVIWYVIKNRNCYREDFRCIACGRNSRQRALVSVLKKVRPNYKNLIIHESSPSKNWIMYGKDNYISASKYSYSYYYPNKPMGSKVLHVSAHRKMYGMVKKKTCKEGTNQNLECLTFSNNTFDIFITQDVFEHVNNPKQGMLEIKRVLKQGGIHIFTVPRSENYNSFSRVKLNSNNEVSEFIQPSEYHGNPIDGNGALVITSWGSDMGKILEDISGMKFTCYSYKKESKYIHAENKEKVVECTDKIKTEGIEGDVEIFVLEKI